MSDSTELGGKLTVTLHIELIETDLDDLRDHLERSLWLPPRELLGNLSQLPTLWGTEQPAPSLQEDETRYVRIAPHLLGRTGIVFAILLQDTNSPSKTQEGSWWVSAIRYRRDRLRLVVVEETGGKSGARLLEWMIRGWGEDSVIVRTNESAPPVSMAERPATYSESEIRTTLAHYLITHYEKTQVVACGLAGVTRNTYRAHVKKRKLLSSKEYWRRTGFRLEDDAAERLGAF